MELPTDQITDKQVPPEIQKLISEAEEDIADDQRQILTNLLLEKESVFKLEGQPLGRTDLVKHEIYTGDSLPVKQPVRRPPIHWRETAELELQKMIDSGVIEPSSSPWASPVVLVKKKDGTARYCIDYRKLNAVTKKDSYPLPRIDDSLDALGKAKYFSTLDLASGYWQIGMTDEAKEKSAFCSTSGLFQFKVMPFGLTNAPATFQRLMERVLAGLQWRICLVYIDDIIIFSETVEEHLKQLACVLERLQLAGLKLKPQKCFLLRKRVAYLGHIVSSQGIEPDPKKISAVKDWKAPTTVTEARSFLGFCSYYRRFMPDFAAVSQPLIKLTEKTTDFVWGEAQETAFEALKEKLVSAPILGFPDPDLSFTLDTDASDHGIGAVLSQVVNGQEVVIAYGSRVLTKPERRYCVTRRELLAVVHFTRVFRHYLLGRPFVLRTDHASLKWLRSFKSPEGQVARWLEALEEYQMEVVHRPGKKHQNADALSREGCVQCGGPHEGEKIRVGRGSKVCVVRTRGRDGQDLGSRPTWLGTQTTNLDDMRAAQRADPTLAAVYRWVEDKVRPPWEMISGEGRAVKFYWGQLASLEIRDGILIRKLERGEFDPRHQILVPKTMQEEVLKQCHEALTAAHLGRDKTIFNVKQRFLWPGMRKQTELFVKACDVCQMYKTSGRTRKAALMEYLSGEPMQRVCIDICGAFPPTAAGMKYVLVVTDCFTKFMEAYAMPDMLASTVARTLVREFFTKFGVPLELHSDQGTNFESALFGDVCTLLGVKKTRTTPFRPQSDGQSERNVKTVTKMLAMLTDEQESWDEYLPFVTMAYRATPHATTQLSPNYMMYGRELFMPIDVMFPLPPDTQPITAAEHAIRMQRKLQYAYTLARKHIKRGAERQKRLYDRKTFGRSYAAGNLVWLLNKQRKKGVSPKLQPNWRGPYLIVKMHNDVLAEVRQTIRKQTTVHTDLLKPCFSTQIPRWMDRVRKRLIS
jgi:transposase InsO family protein